MHKLITDHIDVDELQARYEESLLTGDEETQRVYRRIQELDMMLNEGIRFKIISGMDFCYIRSVWCSIGSPHGGLLQPTFRSTSIWPFIPTAILLDDTYLSYKLAQTNI